MRRITADEIRKFILSHLQGQLEAKGLSPSSVPDDFDLLTEGVVNSMGMVELVVAVEQQFATRLDFEELDPENLTIVGPLCKYIEERSGTRDVTSHEGILGRI